MEDKEKKLYPFRFLEDKEQRPWGEVCYKIADLGLVDSRVKDGWLADNKLSELMGTFMERVVGDDSFEYYGLQFPIMIKSFETSSWQPLQVNVPDAEAEARYDSFGKTALWYVLDAKPGSEIHIGLGRDISSDEFYRRCLDSSVSEVLNVIHPIKDIFRTTFCEIAAVPDRRLANLAPLKSEAQQGHQFFRHVVPGEFSLAYVWELSSQLFPQFVLLTPEECITDEIGNGLNIGNLNLVAKLYQRSHLS